MLPNHLQLVILRSVQVQINHLGFREIFLPAVSTDIRRPPPNTPVAPLSFLNCAVIPGEQSPQYSLNMSPKGPWLAPVWPC